MMSRKRTIYMAFIASVSKGFRSLNENKVCAGLMFIISISFESKLITITFECTTVQGRLGKCKWESLLLM